MEHKISTAYLRLQLDFHCFAYFILQANNWEQRIEGVVLPRGLAVKSINSLNQLLNWTTTENKWGANARTNFKYLNLYPHRGQ